MGNSRSLLTGVRVADFSLQLAGPFCTVMLALLGAEVIKVESRLHPDMFRRRGPGQYQDVHVNKLGITLDLARPEAVKIAKELVGISDVVVENFSPGVMDKLGLGYNELRQIKPDIIMASISGFGATGPECSFRSYAAIFAAQSGLSHLTGYPDGPPTELRGSMDYRAGQMAVVAVLLALVHRQRTGEGQHVDVSAIEGVICRIGDVVLDHTMNNSSPGRMGNRDAIMAPHNCYRCKGEDSWVSIAVATDEEWKMLSKVMGKAALAEQERFADAFLRWQNQDELDRVIEEWTVNHTDYEVMEILQKVGVAAVPSLNAAEIFTDKHLIKRGYIRELEQPEQKRRLIFGEPWKLSSIPPIVPQYAPFHWGRDNEYVLGHLLGMSGEEIARLEREKVLY